jgi:hypothetical protein
VLDQAMKNAYWFWMFPTRGAMSWARMLIDKPEIVSFYNKYLRYSRMSAYQQGAINSKGDPLPSKMGFVPFMHVLGSDAWINPASGLPILNYIFSPRSDSAYQEEDNNQDPVMRMVDTILNQTASRGLRLGPTMELLLLGIRQQVYGEDYKNPYTGQGLAGTIGSYMAEAFIPVPKPLQDVLANFIFRKNGYPGMAKIWNPRVDWFDYMVEIQLLKGLIPKLRNAKSEKERWEILKPYIKVDRALDGQIEYGMLTDPTGDREVYPLWNDGVRTVTDAQLYGSQLP